MPAADDTSGPVPVDQVGAAPGAAATAAPDRAPDRGPHYGPGALAGVEARLKKQYSALDTKMSTLNSLGSYIAQQFGSGSK